MMLTVFLIGLVTSLAVLNVGQDDNDIARLEARRFAALVSQLQDESTLSGFPMGIEISENENRYRFWQLEDQWFLIDKIDVLREREVPDGVGLSVQILQRKNVADEEPEQDSESAEGNTKSKQPVNMVMVEPTGLIRPFIASFRGGSQQFKVSLDNALNPIVSSEAL